uniref:Transcription initiation factor TFIID subunit 12 (inferred by orthology to a human protein) n=1 Tax=Anisakis simplex TaxID=6269 RepID=A0A0M3JFF8_ANISI
LCLHRGSSTLEAKDVNFVLEQYYKMPKMVKTTDVNDLVKTEGNMDGGSAVSRNADLSAHNQRLALIKKTLKKP